MNRRGSLIFVIIFALYVGGAAKDTALAEDFYAGKTIRFVVGAAPDGGYDTYTRAVARHISRHIPGNPSPLVQNMTGAGTLISAHYMYNRAEPDGLTAVSLH